LFIITTNYLTEQMAKILRNYKARKEGNGRPPTYPWDTWLSGDVMSLTQGEDFHSRLLTMQKLIYRTIKRRNYPATIHTVTNANFNPDQPISKENSEGSLIIEPKENWNQTQVTSMSGATGLSSVGALSKTQSSPPKKANQRKDPKKASAK
jgi:hypothetical protein